MALQRSSGVPSGTPGAAPVSPTQAGNPALSTRESIVQPHVEMGVMFGQSLGGREPVMTALQNLQNIGQEHGCDAIIAVKLMQYPTKDRKSTRLNSSHSQQSRMPSSA